MTQPTRQSRSQKRALSLSLSLVSLMGAVGCPGDPPDPVTKLPPQISVTVTRTNVVGNEVPFSVNISGCDAVSQLEIYDRQTFLKTVPATLPTTTAAIQPNELDYTQGLALPIALNAKVTCDDGRTATSRTQALTFLPVEKVFTLPNDEQYVTDLFIAEGSGETTTFLGCFWNAAGYTAIARVNLAGQVVKESASLPFTCTHATVFADRHPTSGKRWVHDPAGAVAIDDNLVISGRFANKIDHLLVASNGDAIVVADGHQLSIVRQSHSVGGLSVWVKNPIATLAGRPAVASGAVYVPVKDYDGIAPPPAPHHISVMRLDAATGDIAGANVVLTNAMDTVPFDSWPEFHVTVSDDGAQVYVPRLVSDTHATVRACTVLMGCNSVLWETAPLDEWPLVLFTYANGSRMTALSGRRVTIFDVNNQGAAFGPSIFPKGAGQFFTHAVPSTSESLFLMSATTNAEGTFNLPGELVALDSARQGLLFRYQSPSGSVAMAFDDSDHPWMRIGLSLVKPFPLADYRAALASGRAPGGP